MTCSKCQTYLCWLCLGILSKVDPYAHFNSKTSICYEKLFEGIDQPDNDRNNHERFEFLPDYDNNEADEDFEVNDDDENDDFIIEFLV